MQPYVKAEDLYRFKLALILGRGKRLKNLLKNYPTERKFKEAPLEEIGEIIGIKNRNSAILNKLGTLDTTYDKMVTFKSDYAWSKLPRAKRIMGIDTEYLKSDLDSIQYVIFNEMEIETSGFIFTNDKIAPSVSVEEGVNILRNVIYKRKPDIIVGHNFNSDISILESAYGDSLPELYFYDDTMDLMEDSHLANIIGGSSLSKAVKKVFSKEVIGLFSAYKNLKLFMEYGIKDAIYPVILRYYILNGKLPEINLNFSLDKVVQEENREILGYDKLKLTI